MDIAFVSNVVYPFVKGGAEKRIYEIGRRLVSNGHEVTIYGRHFWDGPEKMWYEGMRLRAVAPARELYTGERRSITEALEFAIRLLPTLRRHSDEHDVIVVSVFPYFPVATAAMATIGTDTPVVTTWHEVWLDYWDEYLGKLSIGGKLVERGITKIPQHPTAVSNVTANRLARIGPPREHIDVIPNGIDIDKIQTAPVVEDGFDVLFVGRLIPSKRVDYLIEAFDKIADRTDATVGIIGEGPESEALRSKANELDHSERVTFLGFLEDDEEIFGHMRAATVFAAPSVREGFGITYAEAMAADCTVIGADHPDSAADEVIDDAGFVVTPSVDEIADTIARALQGERPSRNPTSRARQFDWDQIAERAAETYRDAMPNR